MRDSAKKKWTGWFRPISRSRAVGPLLVAPVEVIPERRHEACKKIPLVISVPRSCGTAVQRNRFKRIVKAVAQEKLKTEKLEAQQEEKAGPKNFIWIRLTNKHRLNRRAQMAEWRAHLNAALFDI